MSLEICSILSVGGAMGGEKVVKLNNDAEWLGLEKVKTSIICYDNLWNIYITEMLNRNNDRLVLYLIDHGLIV